jgi:hypothetical protein
LYYFRNIISGVEQFASANTIGEHNLVVKINLELTTRQIIIEWNR